MNANGAQEERQQNGRSLGLLSVGYHGSRACNRTAATGANRRAGIDLIAAVSAIVSARSHGKTATDADRRTGCYRTAAILAIACSAVTVTGVRLVTGIGLVAGIGLVTGVGLVAGIGLVARIGLVAGIGLIAVSGRHILLVSRCMIPNIAGAILSGQVCRLRKTAGRGQRTAAALAKLEIIRVIFSAFTTNHTKVPFLRFVYYTSGKTFCQNIIC